MNLKYVNELEKYDLSISDLPEDARTGIEQIKQVERAISMLEAKDKSPSQKTLNKLKAMDKWVSYEIIDFVNETDQNDEDMPYESDELVDEIEDEMEENEEVISTDPRGLQIETELKTLYDGGMRKFDIEDIQSQSPEIYNLLFDTYEPEEDNGVETSRYKLLERTDGMFHLTKK